MEILNFFKKEKIFWKFSNRFLKYQKNYFDGLFDISVTYLRSWCFRVGASFRNIRVSKYRFVEDFF